MRRLKILYALTALLLAGYWTTNLITLHRTQHTPISTATLLCLLLFVSIPAAGYILLFRFVPFAHRLIRR